VKRILCPLVVTLALITLHPAVVHLQQPRRLVAIGDVHGADQAFSAILMRAGLIDASQRWIGGRSILVQTGDMTDRGTGMRSALDLLMSLETQASRAGGAVHAVLGNHEVMNMVGELRDATPQIFETFGGETAMREAFGPKGHYGRWLRRKAIFARVDDSVFMHAGISPEYLQPSLDDLSRNVRREIEQWDEGVRWLVRENKVAAQPPPVAAMEAARAEIERINALAAEAKATPDMGRIAQLLLPVANIGQSSLFAEKGPLWFRGFSMWEEEPARQLIDQLLERHRVKRFVTGHTVQPNGTITERFPGKLFLIDTGMLGRPSFPNGRPSALVIEGDKATPLYLQ
jgi:hypothetical protein